MYLGALHARSNADTTDSADGEAVFSFCATTTGIYRIVCLVATHEQAGMWDVLDVTQDRMPAVVLLRRPS